MAEASKSDTNWQSGNRHLARQALWAFVIATASAGADVPVDSLFSIFSRTFEPMKRLIATAGVHSPVADLKRRLGRQASFCLTLTAKRDTLYKVTAGCLCSPNSIFLFRRA